MKFKYYVFVDENGDLHLAYPGFGVTAGYWFFEDNSHIGLYELLGEL